jgi:hypothetical protein
MAYIPIYHLVLGPLFLRMPSPWGVTHNRDIHKVNEIGGVDLVFSQKIEWHAQHKMNVVKGGKTHMEIQKCTDFREIWVLP